MQIGYNIYIIYLGGCYKLKFKLVLPTLLAGAMLFSGVAFATGEEDLLRAFMYGNKDAAVEILTNNPDVDVNIADGGLGGATLLHYAAIRGWSDVAEMVLRRNPMLVNIPVVSGDTPLHTAVRNSNVDVIRVLLTKGANVNFQNGAGLTPLHGAACRYGNMDSHQNEIIDLLLERDGVNVNLRGTSGETPIHFAAESGNKHVVEALLRKGAIIDSVTSNGSTPLHQAVIHRNTDMAEFLLGHGAQVDIARSLDGATPLHLAIYLGALDLVKLLLNNGADFNKQGPDHMAPLHMAVDRGNFEIARELLMRGANLSLRDGDGLTALERANRLGHNNIAKLISDTAEGRLAILVYLGLMGARL